MKPEDYVSHVGTLSADRVKMTFDENSIAHLQSVLVDLYSDPVLAIIREYSTNALDSHVAAGNPAPIEITLPSQFKREFVVTDYGVGMSQDEIVENYSKYGWSSKRENDDETGMLGLGGKSGLAYTSQFTIISIKDGERVTVLVTREEDGGAALQIIDKEPTDELNGVTITLPVSGSIEHFCDKVREFFRWWDAGTVVLDGEPVVSVWDETQEHPDVLLRIDPDVILMKSQHDRYGITRTTNTIVMGAVPYPLREVRLPRSEYGSTTVVVAARVPIGSVNFVPSRESLNMKSRKTKEAISELETFLRTAMGRIIEEKIANAPDHATAYKLVQELQSTLPFDRRVLRYKGDDIPTTQTQIVGKGRVFSVNRQVKHYSRSDRANVSNWINYGSGEKAALIVLGFHGRGLHASLKDKARWYCEQQALEDPDWDEGDEPTSWNEGQIYFVEATQLLAPWCNHFHTATYDEIKKVAVPDNEVTVVAKRMRVVDHGGYTEEVSDLPSSTVCYVKAADWADLTSGTCNLLPSGALMAILRKPEETRVLRKNPGMLELREWLTIEVRVRLMSVTEEVASIVHGFQNRLGIPDKPSRAKLVDSELRALYDKLARLTNPSPMDAREARWWAQAKSNAQTLKAFDLLVTILEAMTAKVQTVNHQIDRAIKRYPVLDKMPLPYSEHAIYVEMLNAFYYTQHRCTCLVRLDPQPNPQLQKETP